MVYLRSFVYVYFYAIDSHKEGGKENDNERKSEKTFIFIRLTVWKRLKQNCGQNKYR